MDQETRSYSVKQYMTSLKRTLETTPTVWVHGVITQINEKSKVVYLSIADFAEGCVEPQATIPLYCFTFKFNSILAKIATLEKPFVLKTDLKVKFLIKADLYIPYGKLQAQILDIDPVYTIGELALTKSAILKRLALEGLLEKNKNQDLAEVPLNIGLITGQGTAAYQDFTTKLKESPFAFKITTAYARMQGSETENSVLEALEILKQNSEIDVVCIIRGGGSKTDLNYFDSEALCRAVANYPIPVFTGIGHEIDKSLLDEVSYQYCITPTDCAKRLVDRVQNSWQRMMDVGKSIAEKARNSFMQEKTLHAQMAVSLKKTLSFVFKTEYAKLDRNRDGLNQGTRKILDLAKSKFDILELKVKSVDPSTVLAKGYTLTLDENGKFLRSKKSLTSGKKITTLFKDGEIKSVVED